MDKYDYDFEAKFLSTHKNPINVHIVSILMKTSLLFRQKHTLLHIQQNAT